MSSDMQLTKVKEEPMDGEFEAGDYMIHVKQEPSDVSKIFLIGIHKVFVVSFAINTTGTR